MNIVYDYLRPLKAHFLKEWYEKPLNYRDNVLSVIVENSTILPLKKEEGSNLLFGRGDVIDASGKYIPESGIEQRIWGSYTIENVEYRDETVVYCGYLVNQWGHFLVEAITRLWYVMHEECSIDKYVFFLEENTTRKVNGNYREFLELLGIWEKLEFITTPVRYKKVIIPEMSYKRFSYYSKYYKDIFENVVNNALFETEGSKNHFRDNNIQKIFFSRSKIPKTQKYELELDSLDDFFVSNGYQIVFPETLSLTEMISLLHSTDILATLSGSVHHNVLFAPDGLKIEIFERFPINIDYQVQINMIKDLDVTYIDACFPIYPTNLSGPLIMGYTKQMKAFAASSNYQMLIDRKVKKITKTLAAYMKAYHREYGYGWYSEDWYFPRYSAIYEGYLESAEIFGDYLYERKPFMLIQYFHPRFIKRLIKICLSRI